VAPIDPNACFNHATADKAGVCLDCGLSFCGRCLTTFQNAAYCAACKNYRTRIMQRRPDSSKLALASFLIALAAGPVMFLLVPTSIIGLTFIIERGLALRWKKVIPPDVEKALDLCRSKQDLGMLQGICQQQPSALSRLLLVALEHLSWPKEENADAIQTRARHEIAQMERGLVIVEIVVGIAPRLRDIPALCIGRSPR